MVFVNESNHKVLNVENPDSLKNLMGHCVAVKGAVDDATGMIHVDEVNQLSEKGQKTAEALRQRWNKKERIAQFERRPKQPQFGCFFVDGKKITINSSSR